MAVVLKNLLSEKVLAKLTRKTTLSGAKFGLNESRTCPKNVVKEVEKTYDGKQPEITLFMSSNLSGKN